MPRTNGTTARRDPRTNNEHQRGQGMPRGRVKPDEGDGLDATLTVRVTYAMKDRVLAQRDKGGYKEYADLLRKWIEAKLTAAERDHRDGTVTIEAHIPPRLGDEIKTALKTSGRPLGSLLTSAWALARAHNKEFDALFGAAPSGPEQEDAPEDVANDPRFAKMMEAAVVAMLAPNGPVRAAMKAYVASTPRPPYQVPTAVQAVIDAIDVRAMVASIVERWIETDAP